MAYMNQKMKQEIMQRIKEIAPKNWRITANVDNYSTINVVIRQMPKSDFLEMTFDDVKNETNMKHKKFRLDFENTSEVEHEFYLPLQAKAGGFNQDSATFTIIKKIAEAINKNNYDNSEIMTDYHDVGFYAWLKLGDYKKPCKLI